MRYRSRFALVAILWSLHCGILKGQQPSPVGSSGDVLFQAAMAQLSQGKYVDAEASFRKLADLEPATSRGILGVAEVWVAQKKNEDALQLLQTEAAKYPNRLELHFGIGNVALRAAKYDFAIAEYQTVLDRVDRNSKSAAELYFRMAEAYRLKGDLDFAISLLRQAERLQPDNRAVVNMLAFTLEAAGHRQAAVDEYRKLLQYDPNNALALNNLAYILADMQDDLGLALAYVHRARELFPEEPTFKDTAGWVYVKLNRVEASIPLFREVVHADPNRATYRYHLALALEMNGDHEEASRESEAALKSNPSKDDEQKIKELLQRIGRTR
jgi:tetratricopeptide (TPR) repeat protein